MTAPVDVFERIDDPAEWWPATAEQEAYVEFINAHEWDDWSSVAERDSIDAELARRADQQRRWHAEIHGVVTFDDLRWAA